MKTVQVVLMQPIAGIGNADEVKEVSEGYARNFLFPRHLAVLANNQTVTQAGARAHKKTQDTQSQLQRQQSLAGQLDGYEVEFKEKMSASGHLYAAIGPARVAEQLTKLGFSIKKTQLQMSAIKSAGDFKAVVRFSHGLESDIRIIVLGQ